MFYQPRVTSSLLKQVAKGHVGAIGRAPERLLGMQQTTISRPLAATRTETAGQIQPAALARQEPFGTWRSDRRDCESCPYQAQSLIHLHPHPRMRLSHSHRKEP